jgi:hypothetical protein
MTVASKTIGACNGVGNPQTQGERKNGNSMRMLLPWKDGMQMLIRKRYRRKR